MYKLFKILVSILIIFTLLWGFSASYSSHNIDNIVHVVAIGIDKSEDSNDNIKVSFQFVYVSSSSGSEGSSGGENSTVVTSIKSSSLNKAINLMNSYIGKELNFAHCKVIVFSEVFAREGISTEIYTLVNNEELRPNANIIISTSDANSYLKNSNPNIEKLVTNYYDTFELTSNFTGYSDDITLGKFFNNLFTSSQSNTAILGRTFKKASSADSSSDTSQSSQENEQNSASKGESTQQQKSEQSKGKESSQEDEASQNNMNQSSQSSGNESGQSSGGNSLQYDSGGASLEISGQRGTQNVGIAVFKEDKYIDHLSEMESICHLLITNNVNAFVLSINMEDYPDNLLDLNISPVRNTKVEIDTSSDQPTISINVYCDAKILTVGKNYDYANSEVLDKISAHAEKYLKERLENYLNKVSKELNCDIDGFSQQALANFSTIPEWVNYDWASKYANANFNVNVNLNVTSSLLFSGDQ